MFDRDEERAFLFLLKPADHSYEINKFKPANLGNFNIKWVNYFGDRGSMTLAPRYYPSDIQSKFKVKVIPA
jgi:hypothetical protein